MDSRHFCQYESEINVREHETSSLHVQPLYSYIASTSIKYAQIKLELKCNVVPYTYKTYVSNSAEIALTMVNAIL